MPVTHDDARTQRDGENQRDEIARQRTTIEQLATKIAEIQRQLEQAQQRAPGAEPQGQGNGVPAADIGDILNAFTSGQSEIKFPKFEDESKTNPVKYIDDLERYFRVKNVGPARKLLTVESTLEGKARTWLDLSEGIDSYETFKNQFLEKFYSVPIRIEIKKKWTDEKYKPYEGGLQSYFYRKLKEATHFIPKLSIYEINYMICQQFPVWVRESLASIKYEETDAIGRTLANLDAVRIEKEREATRRQSAYSNRPNDPVRVRNIQRHDYQARNYEYGRPNSDGRYGQNVGEREYNRAPLPDMRYPPPQLINRRVNDAERPQSHLNGQRMQ